MRFHVTSILVCVGSVVASTAPGTLPSSNNDMIVVFGSTTATQGREVLRSITAGPPEIGTVDRLYGTYTLMMVDYDIPQAPGTKLLHWMQQGLQSSQIATSLAGTTLHMLTNNTPPAATYLQPSPPPRAPFSHRYVEMLLNTTNNPNAETVLRTAALTRNPFDPEKAVRDAGVTVVAGNWFVVTASNSTGSPSGTGTAGMPRYTGAASSVQGGLVGVVGGALIMAAGLL